MREMTWQEKKEFAERITSEPIQKKLQRGRRYFRSGLFWLIGGGLAIVIVLIFEIFRASFFLPLALFMWIDFTAADFYRFYIYAVKTVTRESAKKIGYREYCHLEKTGELDNWLKEPKQAKVENGNLSAEEIALLKKLLDKQEQKNTSEDVFE